MGKYLKIYLGEQILDAKDIFAPESFLLNEDIFNYIFSLRSI